MEHGPHLSFQNKAITLTKPYKCFIYGTLAEPLDRLHLEARDFACVYPGFVVSVGGLTFYRSIKLRARWLPFCWTFCVFLFFIFCKLYAIIFIKYDMYVTTAVRAGRARTPLASYLVVVRLSVLFWYLQPRSEGFIHIFLLVILKISIARKRKIE